MGRAAFQFRLGVVAILLLVPLPAFAHSPIEGIGSFWAGLLHPLMIPAHIIALVTFGLLTGLQEQKTVEYVLLAFVAAEAAGLLCAGLGFGFDAVPLLLSCSAVCGILVAISPRLPKIVALIIVVPCALLLGLDSFPDAATPKENALGLFGTGVGAGLGFFYMMVLSFRLTRPWQRIGVKIIGSWAAASALLVLTLTLVGAAP